MSSESKPLNGQQSAALNALSSLSVDSPATNGDAESSISSQPSTASSSKKKKKGKAKSAANKIKDAFKGDHAISDKLYDAIKDQVALEKGQAQADQLDKQTVSEMVETMKLKEMLSGKIGVGGKNRKDMADYKFWNSQPVPKLGQAHNVEEDKAIDPDKKPEEIRQEPYFLPQDFEWDTMDVNDPVQVTEIYKLLTANYVEDDDASFRFDYSADFIEWALKPPGYVADWHIGVRVAGTKKLVAFISGIPMHLRVRQADKRCSEINFLCVHKKLRGKRLAPVLIKEVTRRCHLAGVFQAIYTAGVFLPTPISACQYYHRPIRVPKLVQTGFLGVPRNTTYARLQQKHALPTATAIPGLREIEEKDVAEVGVLMREYLRRFDTAPIMNDDEIRHNFLSGKGREVDGKRQGQVTWSYVVEDPTTHRITDFFSFYSLPSTAMRTNPPSSVNAAYLFYYATSSCPACAPAGSTQGKTWDQETMGDRKVLEQRLNALIKDALVVASEAKFDVFNALTLMDNNLFLEQQKFGKGDGFLFYYLYNWMVKSIAGGCEDKSGVNTGVGASLGSGVGVVML